MEWSKVLRWRDGRKVEIDPRGIVLALDSPGGNQQGLERQTRESAAAPFLSSTEAAMREVVRHHSKGVMRARARQVIEGLAAATRGSEAVLLDLGSGFGWHWIDLAREFSSLRFVMVDFALANLLVCRTLMPFDHYPNVLCVQADLVDLPLEDEVADYCWSVQVLQHLPQEKRRQGLQEIKRVLKPNGRFYFGWLRSVPLVKFIFRLFGRPYLERGTTQGGVFLQRFDQEVSRELREAFTVISRTYSETLFHPDLHWAPSSPGVSALDLCLAKTPAAPWLARQSEVWGLRPSVCGE